MPSEREIAFAKYWEGKEGRKLTIGVVRDAYLAGWSDKPEVALLPDPSAETRARGLSPVEGEHEGRET